jgi:hypothetical protein
MTVSRFNELFIGDLAFLAMLIGMNSSSGTHCLLCMKSKAEFNCNHQSLVPRTKESLRECLEQYLLLVQNSTSAKPPANSKGVNSQGLLDVDPQRIVIPILHCPMGLVDKILEISTHIVKYEKKSSGLPLPSGSRTLRQGNRRGERPKRLEGMLP